MADGIVNGPIPSSFLADTSTRLSSMRFDVKSNVLEVLDQLLLPHGKKYVRVKNSEDGAAVIKNMQVRGAPLIAVVGALSLFVELQKLKFDSVEKFVEFIKAKTNYLLASRPTAINLSNALKLIVEAAEHDGSVEEKLESVENVILKLYYDEQDENRRLVWNGYQEIINLNPSKQKLTIMTICNTGSLATCSWGTALGIIRALHFGGRLEMAYALETRPYNQGIRLTATELLHGNVPFKVITDSMAAWTMKNVHIDAIVVGADQVALNGDTANKIGTYMLAVLAKHHSVPFYPIVPLTTINRQRENGDDIPIEERPAKELLTVNGTYIGPEEAPVWNPAFDVTPGDLITKVITDFGNYKPSELKAAVRSL